MFFFSDLTASSTAFLFFESLSLPLRASSTIGLVPLAWLGSGSWSRSCARVEPVPGSVRLSLICSPAARLATRSAMAKTTQSAITGQWWREHTPPSR